MSLTLYNTLTRKKEAFTPIDPARVRMYVCGPTVYDYAHIGNARPVIVFDVLFRLLKHIYGESHVTYVRNITDVDDKINDRAARDFPNMPLNDAIRKVTESTAAQFHSDVAALGCLPPTVEPRATDNIKQMVDIIGRLLESGHAYIEQGDKGLEVLFSVKSMPAYGELSNRSLNELKAGARVNVDLHKRNPGDFVLWKQSADDEPGWFAEFSPDHEYRQKYRINQDRLTIFGRPGWHIECSAMSHRYLGETFDIHGGGIDLVFPHHENEIAQSTCAFGHNVMANVFMHNGFLQVEGQKMSKSLGNFRTINEILKNYSGTVLRFTMLETHYRQPIDWRERNLVQAQFTLSNWANVIINNGLTEYYLDPKVEDIDVEVVKLLSDDLNTPAAIMRLNQLRHEGIGNFESAKKFAASAALLGFKNLHKPGFFSPTIISREKIDPEVYHLSRSFQLAVANSEPTHNFKRELKVYGWDCSISDDGFVRLVRLGEQKENIEQVIEFKITQRLEARRNKDFAESDRIRDELLAMGIQLKDGKDANGNPVTTWEVKR